MVRKTHPEPGDPAAGNGILSRRIFLEGALVVGATGAGLSCASAEPLTVQPWMKVPGPGFEGYGQPSPFESKVVKVFPPPPSPAGVGASRTPLHLLEGMITPSGLHFDRSHSGIPRATRHMPPLPFARSRTRLPLVRPCYRTAKAPSRSTAGLRCPLRAGRWLR